MGNVFKNFEHVTRGAVCLPTHGCKLDSGVVDEHQAMQDDKDQGQEAKDRNDFRSLLP